MSKNMERENMQTKINEQVKKDENLERLVDIAVLRDDWDGEGAKAIPGSAVSFAKMLIKTLTFQPKVFPTMRESIQLEFERQDRSYLEFEIFSNKVICLEVPERRYEQAVFHPVSFGDTEAVEQIVRKFIQ